MQFWMYVLTCADDSYYVGHTDDLEKRLAAHNDGTFGGYTAKRRPIVLAYAEVFDSRDEAFRRERQVIRMVPSKEGSADSPGLD